MRLLRWPAMAVIAIAVACCVAVSWAASQLERRPAPLPRRLYRGRSRRILPRPAPLVLPPDFPAADPELKALSQQAYAGNRMPLAAGYALAAEGIPWQSEPSSGVPDAR